MANMQLLRVKRVRTGRRLAAAATIFLSIISTCGPQAFGATPTISDYYERMVSKYERQGVGVFVSACLLSDSTNIMWFPLGTRGGQYVEYFKNGLLLNGGDIKFDHSRLAAMDLGGGEGTQAAQQRIIAGLLKSSFRFVPADQLRATFLGKTKDVCSPD
jgi:hypothetical protein